jgi:predicted deacylase
VLFRGAREGNVLVGMAGVHGDEYEGPRAILDVCSTLDPEAMSGDLIAVPVAKPPAFWAGTRPNAFQAELPAETAIC